MAGEPAPPGGGGGGFWPNEVSAKVREQTEIVSSVFIGLMGKLFKPARLSALAPASYPRRDKCESSKSFGDSPFDVS